MTIYRYISIFLIIFLYIDSKEFNKISSFCRTFLHKSKFRRYLIKSIRFLISITITIILPFFFIIYNLKFINFFILNLKLKCNLYIILIFNFKWNYRSLSNFIMKFSFFNYKFLLLIKIPEELIL